MPTTPNMLGFCYEGALNSQLYGGSLTWEGEGTWEPVRDQAICVDWNDEFSFAWTCGVQQSGPLVWTLVNCNVVDPEVVCP